MKKKAFTLMEVIISCGVLSIFMVCIVSLYSSGSKMSNSAMWLQNVTAQLKTASRQINTSIRKSSYPAKIVFPQNIIEAKNTNFNVHYFLGNLLTTNCSTGEGTKFLVTTEATPEKTGGNGDYNQVASLTYHIFTLAKNGYLSYSRYEESANNITDSFTRTIPSGKLVYNTVLVKDVESVNCEAKDGERNNSPIEVTINCKMPKSPTTTRKETTVGVPNVAIDNNL